MRVIRLVVASLFLIIAGLAISPVTTGADFGVAPPAASIEATEAGASAYLARKTVLHQIRAMFDVISDEELGLLVAEDMHRVRAAGVTQEDMENLHVELTVEGSYLITSLRYLVEVGIAAWPPDRAEGAYANDALVRLAALARDFVETMRSDGDPLPLMQTADEIYWQTEGYAEIPPGEGHFAGRDALLEEAARSVVLRAAT